MPLTREIPSAVQFLVPGAVAGVVSFAFSRVMIEPLIGAAVDYEAAREHEHGHEVFSRAIQQNIGAAVGVVVFGIVMGVLFAVAYTAIRGALERRGFVPDPTGLALLLSAGMFAALALMPSLKYPANPPTVGLEETVAERSSSFLAITVVSVVGACLAVGAGLAWSRPLGIWRASAVAVGGYVAVVVCAMVLLPSFHEVPGPTGGLDGFPAEVLAEFRLYSLVNHVLMWAVIGVTWACLTALALRRDQRIYFLGRATSRVAKA
jgi:predicted cobalt transporter CbtA